LLPNQEHLWSSCTCTFDGGNPKEQSASIQTASTWLQDSEFLNGLKESFLRQAWRDPNEISISLCNDSVGIDSDRLLLVAREELDRDCHDGNSKLEPRFNASIDLLTKDLFVRLKPAKREKIANAQSEFKCLCESNERAMQDACYIGKPSAPSARKVDASPSRPFSSPGGLMERFNASLQRDRKS
jgi:hypothetical protein